MPPNTQRLPGPSIPPSRPSERTDGLPTRVIPSTQSRRTPHPTRHSRAGGNLAVSALNGNRGTLLQIPAREPERRSILGGNLSPPCMPPTQPSRGEESSAPTPALNLSFGKTTFPMSFRGACDEESKMPVLRRLEGPILSPPKGQTTSHRGTKSPPSPQRFALREIGAPRIA